YAAIGNHPCIVRSLGLRDMTLPSGNDREKFPPGARKGLILEQLSGNITKANKELKAQFAEGKIKHEEYWGVVHHTLISTLQGLDHLASRGFVHCDIKPDNVMYNAATGDVKLVDMGTVIREYTRPDDGTAQYQADEMLAARRTQGRAARPVESQEDLNAKVTAKADVFMLGAMLHEFGEGSDFNSNERDERLEGLQSAYVQFLNQVLDPDPARRLGAREALEHPFLKDRLLPE